MQRKQLGVDSKNDLVTAINRHYDKIMFTPRARERYGGSDFHNFGYWDQATTTLREACENLMEKLLAFIPEKEGTILDVACGKGATSRYLLKYYNPKDVTGINISKKQLGRCRANAPGCNFFLMNATKLAFPDESFNNIICVEAAFHFNTREKFLHEASRVLKPAGRLVLSDILGRYQAVPKPRSVVENYVRDLPHHRKLCFNAGFEQVEIIDATLECWVSFHRYALRFLRNQFHSGKIDRPTFIRRQRRNKRNQTMAYYVLVSARKADRNEALRKFCT